MRRSLARNSSLLILWFTVPRFASDFRLTVSNMTQLGLLPVVNYTDHCKSTQIKARCVFTAIFTVSGLALPSLAAGNTAFHHTGTGVTDGSRRVSRPRPVKTGPPLSLQFDI